MDEIKIGQFEAEDKLHTDILKQKYGPIHAIVLRHDSSEKIKNDEDRIRETRLVDEKGIMRTYALAFIDYDIRNNEVVKIDNEIRRGGLIGQTFRKYSYVTKRNMIDIFTVYLPSWAQKEFKVDTKEAKARLVELYVRKDDTEPISYGIVLEILSPDFEDPYRDNSTENDNINPPITALQKAGIPTDEIWSSLGEIKKNNRQGDLRDKYEKARRLSRPLLKSLYSKIANYLGPNLLSS